MNNLIWRLFLLLATVIPTVVQAQVKDSLSLKEVTVTERYRPTSINTISSAIDQTHIELAMGKSLASLLEHVSGVSSIQTGTTIAKPVIQGMYGTRILVVNNGARLTGQQWGADHAPEVDKNSYDRIDVVKGAESVRYGSEALGGIIIMEQKALPYGTTRIGGSLGTMYGSNGHRYTFVGKAEGALLQEGRLAWRLQGMYGNSGDQKTAHYLLNNTGYRELNLSAALGYRLGKVRIEGNYSLFHQKLGVMQSAQMGNEQLLMERVTIGRPVDIYPFTRSISYPHQIITHHTAIFKAFYTDEKWGNFEWQTTFQHDDRRENRIRRMNHSDIPTVSLRLSSWQNALNWNKGYGAWKTEAGMLIVNVNNSNERGTGVVPIIPNYTEFTAGVYGFQKYTANRWGTELGARFDFQHTEADGYDWTGLRYGGKRNFGSFTYSLGGHYNPSKQWRLATNFGLAWRAPHVYELYSNGNELSSGMFVKGDSDLKSEQSYKWITSIEFSQKWLRLRLDAYLQWINNYIYDQPTRQNITVISGSYPVFQYKQTSAFFRGFDFDMHFLPIQQLDYHLITSFIWANERRTGNYLPYIPSARLIHELTWKPVVRGRVSPYFSVNHKFVAKQKRFNPDTDLINFTPAAYHLFGFEVGLDWKLRGNRSLYLSLMGDNILNREYKEYTNRGRYYAHDLGRDIRCTATWEF